MASKHTEGKIKVRPAFDLVTLDGGYVACAATVADTKRIALCWNMHDRLVRQLRRVTLEATPSVNFMLSSETLDEIADLLAEIDGAK